MVNKNVLTARLERLVEYIKILKVVQEYDLERFVEDPFIHGTAERNLHLAIECLLDIGNHVISDRDYPKPENYADIFRILNDQGVIPGRLLDDLQGMAAFRNVLVHDYLRLDRGKVYRIVCEKTEVMEKLAAIYVGML